MKDNKFVHSGAGVKTVVRGGYVLIVELAGVVMIIQLHASLPGTSHPLGESGQDRLGIQKLALLGSIH